MRKKRKKKRKKVFRTMEEYIRTYYPEQAEEMLNPKPQRVIVIFPRPGV